MVKVVMIAVGSLKEDYLRAAAEEYKKRLGAFASVETVELKEAPVRDEDSPAAIADALADEGKRILSKIPPRAYSIALCVEGEMLSSEEFSACVRLGVDARGTIAVVIGSSHGLSDEVKRACDRRLSFSRLTFPHQLARVLAYEQLYRAFSIAAGRRYHK